MTLEFETIQMIKIPPQKQIWTGEKYIHGGYIDLRSGFFQRHQYQKFLIRALKKMLLSYVRQTARQERTPSN